MVVLCLHSPAGIQNILGKALKLVLFLWVKWFAWSLLNIFHLRHVVWDGLEYYFNITSERICVPISVGSPKRYLEWNSQKRHLSSYIGDAFNGLNKIKMFNFNAASKHPESTREILADDLT